MELPKIAHVNIGQQLALLSLKTKEFMDAMEKLKKEKETYNEPRKNTSGNR